MKIHEGILQGSPEWNDLRAGKATASCFADVLAKGQGKTRAKYLRKIVAERLLGRPLDDGYRNAHMDRGVEQEPMARMAYEASTDNEIRRVAFLEHDTLRAGCSPDSLVIGRRRGVEVKCVIETVQIETLLCGTYPPEHKAQVQGSMWISEYEEWDFVSYSPNLPPRNRLYVYTVKRDDSYIKELESEVRRFLSEVDRIVEHLNGGPDLEAQLRASLKAAA